VVFLGSDMRIRMMEAIFGRDKVVGLQIGTSPIQEDKNVDASEIRSLIQNLKSYNPK
jgi:predicted hydrolase (HD superfamily)